jgi:hypothetical protein
LDGVEAPADLFRAAIDQREQPEVVAYRNWLRTDVQAWIANGRMPQEAHGDVDQIVEDIKRKYATRGPLDVDVETRIGPWPPSFAIKASGQGRPGAAA